MYTRQSTANLVSSLVAALMDGLAVFGGLVLAARIRFDSGWFAIDPLKGRPTPGDILWLSLLAAALFVLVFRSLSLYRRPHQGRFEDKIPRIVRAVLTSFVLYIALEAALRIDPAFSRAALLIGLGTVTFLVLLERYLLYRIEWNLARKMEKIGNVLIIGTDAVAVRLRRAIEQDPFLRSRVLGYLSPRPGAEVDAQIPPDAVLGDHHRFDEMIRAGSINHVILTDMSLDREALTHLILTCEHNYIQFNLVPDVFRLLTSEMSVQSIAGVPVLGLERWPLDFAENRLLKRAFDLSFSLVALILSSPVLLLAALAVKLSSRGPVFYLQERCGYQGHRFRMVKLRTMRVDAEKDGPGWTRPDDPRRTPVGGFLRRWNIDELPQFFNVLAGQMSVCGPRPERPHFVEQFKGEIQRYMRRHQSKPGITGWAQVHGLRGDTSIQDRITHDLFYLENWSVGLDLKIVLKTLVSRRNAY